MQNTASERLISDWSSDVCSSDLCALRLWWPARRRGSEGVSGTAGTTGHVWDGDLREYTKPMPRWWIIWFYLTIVFAIGYLVWYPGFGNFAELGRASCVERVVQYV